jgi:hypothetical protein
LIDEFSSRRVVRDITRTQVPKRNPRKIINIFSKRVAGSTSRDAVSRVGDARDDCVIVETSENFEKKF